MACLGPLPQREFLKNMGIDARMQASLDVRSDDSSKGRGLDSAVLCRFC